MSYNQIEKAACLNPEFKKKNHLAELTNCLSVAKRVSSNELMSTRAQQTDAVKNPSPLTAN